MDSRLRLSFTFRTKRFCYEKVQNFGWSVVARNAPSPTILLSECARVLIQCSPLTSARRDHTDS